LLFEIAAEHAALREDVKGPGTFIPAFIDELYQITKQTASGNNGWLAASKVAKMEI
jgi:thiamine-phosphate diphosphorylase / hydroxyethylthiazole kinase